MIFKTKQTRLITAKDMIILLIPITLVLIMLFYVIFEMAFGTEKKEHQDFKDSMSKEEYDNLKKNDN